MKVSWAVIIGCCVMVVGGVAVLAPAGYGPGGVTGDPYAGYGYEMGGGGTETTGADGTGADANELLIDEDTPSMLLEKEAFFADPNAVKALIQAYPELEAPLVELSRRSRTEVRQWLSYKENTDLRIGEVRALLLQSTTELQVLKKVAAADGAKRTVAAIDALLLERKGRYERLAQEFVLQQRKLAAERNQTGTDGTGRTSTRRSQYNTRSGYGTGRTGGRGGYTPGRR